MVTRTRENIIGSRKERSIRPYPIESRSGEPEFVVRVEAREVSYAALKRLLDLSMAATFLTLGAPIFILIALIIKVTSPGPVIFRQERVGLGGRRFTFYKFRSMYADAEARREHLMQFNEASGPIFKIKNDPRVTPVGRVLRRFSLDELPQFFNVLKGDMSMVGPRPPLVCEVMHYNEREKQRLSVVPGLTCLWQIEGRSNIGFDQWMELDLLYISTMSFGSDIKIFLKTIPAVLSARGAH